LARCPTLSWVLGRVVALDVSLAGTHAKAMLDRKALFNRNTPTRLRDRERRVGPELLTATPPPAAFLTADLK